MNITGQILDFKTKKPIAGVNVKFNDVLKAQTDSDGKYSFIVNSLLVNDVIETSHVSYSPLFTAASDFPKIAYMDDSGNALNEVVIKSVIKKSPWLLWIGLGVTVGAIFAYKKNQDRKKIVKAKI